MNLKIIYNKEDLRNLEIGSIITIVKEGNSLRYRLVGFCPFDTSNNTVILSNLSNKAYHNELFRVQFKNNKSEVWIKGDALKNNREEVEIQIVYQLKHKIDNIKFGIGNYESQKLDLIQNSNELKKTSPKTPVTIIHNGRIKNLCFLSFIENPKMFLFCRYAISHNPPIPSFMFEDIFSGDSYKIGIKKNYNLFMDNYEVHLNYILVKGVFGNYNIHCREVMEIQIFQLQNLINSYLNMEQSTIQEYYDLLTNCMKFND